MRENLKKCRTISLTLIFVMFIISIIMITSCGNNTNNDSENKQNGETTLELSTSSATSEAEGVDAVETTESNFAETTEANSTEEPIVDNNIYIIVESSSAKIGGKNVEINILFKNNPGIFGMDFDLYYDDSVMTLIDAISFIDTDSCVFTRPKKYHSPSTFLWDFQDGFWVRDGVFLKLLFNISEAAQSGDYAIEVKYSLGNIFDKDFNPIIICTENGVLNISD